MTPFAIATFCYGQRYYDQANRMIKSFDNLSIQPTIFVVTDSVESIEKRSFVFVDSIESYDKKYTKYASNYYDFDFSVKRFSLLFALKNNFNKIILVDADILPGISFTQENIMACFTENSVSGPVNFILENEINTNSMLGRRMLHYSKKLEINIDIKDMLVSEDCVQYFDIDTDKFYSFLSIWEECIKIKNADNLPNIPAGNIDEIAFSAIYNNIKLINNSNLSCNLLNAHHNKWYA